MKTADVGYTKALCAAMAALACALAPAANAQRAPDPVVVSEQFQEVMSRLDTGGEFLMIVNVDGVLDRTINDISDLMSRYLPEGSVRMETMRTIGRLRPFLTRNGFNAVKALGCSSVPRRDGIHDVKFFLSRGFSAVDTHLWRGLVGWKPRNSRSLGFFPTDTVAAVVSHSEPARLWLLARSAILDVAPAPVAAEFDEELTKASRDLGVSFDELLASLGDEWFVSLQMDRDRKVRLPDDLGRVEIGSPSFLAAMAIKDDKIQIAIDRLFAQNKIVLSESREGSVAMKSAPKEDRSGIAFQPTYAVTDGFLLFGSNQKVVRQAIRSNRTGIGLLSDPEFSNAFAALPERNNGRVFISKRMSQELGALQRQFLAELTQAGRRDVARDSADSSEIPAVSINWASAMVVVNEKNGVRIHGVSAQGGAPVIAALTASPIGMIAAALAIPSFVQARHQSARNACINNLRQIDAAKEQAALEHRWVNGAPVSNDDLKVNSYIKGNKTPQCPDGGTYTYGPIGENPKCSVAGHAFPTFR